MGKLIYLLLLLLVLNCEKPAGEPERNFHFKIACNEYHNNEQTRAILLYYDNSMNLLSYRNSLNGEGEVFLTRTDSTIDLGENRYCCLDSGQRIIEYIYDRTKTLFTYSGKSLLSSKVLNGNHLICKTYYSYSGTVIRDSTMFYTDSGNAFLTRINHITYIDTLCPAAKVHPTGLINYPEVTEFLIDEIESANYSHRQTPDSIHKYRYQYIISENRISEYLDIWNGSGALIDQWHSVYNMFENRYE